MGWDEGRGGRQGQAWERMPPYSVLYVSTVQYKVNLTAAD